MATDAVIQVVLKELLASSHITSLKARRKAAIGLQVGIRMVLKSKEVIREGVDVGRRELGSAHQLVEGGIESLNIGAVATPVERCTAEHPAESLRDHRTLHRMDEPIS